MKIELRIHADGKSIVIDGEDSELMSPQRREWVMRKLVQKLDHRYLETVVGAVADKYGDVMCEDDFDLYIHEL